LLWQALLADGHSSLQFRAGSGRFAEESFVNLWVCSKDFE
jgi:hypothetical protein